MKPMSKFAIFLALAGILTVLFALVPSHKSAPRAQPSQTEGSNAAAPEAPVVPGAGPAGHSRVSLAAPSNVCFLPNPAATGVTVKVPAIRGATNYGWVQLPRGTAVDFVRQDRNRLWVRWDGVVIEVPQTAAATGALNVRRPLAERS